MGNSSSQPRRPTKPLYLFYLIHRTWCIVLDHRKEQPPETDRDTDFSSRCSGCQGCDYRQDSLTFDSASEMAPNAEEELLVVKPWGPRPEKERLRPPTYNAEDYAIALRRWGRRPLATVQDSQGTLPSTASSSSGYASGCGEMTLRQFTSVSELLNKLRADLRLAFPSFVQEFASPPADGITLLLETLRGVQIAQSSPPSSGQTGPRVGTRRAALDELGCVECLAACGERCADAPRLLVQAQSGLLALAVCLTSSLNRSRVLALQLLTKVCQTAGGHAAVSEAVSTLRLRYGEGGRFRFLAGALLAPRAAIALRVAGVAFLNAFLKSAPRTQTRLYIQAEACEAGLEPEVLEEWLREFDDREEDSLTELLHKEVQKWSNNCVDVDALERRALRAEETCRILSKKVSALQNQLQKFQLDKMNSYNLDDRQNSSIDATKTQKLSSNADDEGISSSERSSSPEDTKSSHRIQKVLRDNDQETTIEDVIEELRIIVKDAEEEFSEKKTDIIGKPELSMKNKLFRSNSKNSSSFAESINTETIQRRVESKRSRTKEESSVPANQDEAEQVTYFGTDRDCSTDSNVTRCLSSNVSRRISRSSTEGSVRIVVKGPEVEEAIVPAILHPQPPRRTPPCLSAIIAARRCDVIDHEEPYNSPDEEEVDEETLGDGSDSLLSASRLKYNRKAQEEENNVMQHQQKLPGNDVLLTSHKETVEKFKKSFDDVPDSSGMTNGTEKIEWETKAARNYESSKKTGPTSRHLNDCQTAVHRHGTRYKSEVEKRKLLRRSASHDYLESSASSPQTRRSAVGRVECRIRKFESLNSFDEQRSLRSYRLASSENLSRQSGHFDDVSRSRMRRSESFHHVSHVAKRERASSNGGSDSGLFYITDYNLDPPNGRRARSIEAPRSPNLLTKSLDRIDEGLDSMVDIVITEDKNQWKRYDKSRKPRQDGQPTGKAKSKKNDGLYAGQIVAEQLKSDELYEDQQNRQWDYQNELNSSIKNRDFDYDVAILSKPAVRHNSFRQNDKKISQRPNDTGIFAGRTYDTFGLGKSRFNAGKYSGNHPAKENVLGRRNTTSALIGQRGKVTDIISGLY